MKNLIFLILMWSPCANCFAQGGKNTAIFQYPLKTTTPKITGQDTTTTVYLDSVKVKTIPTKTYTITQADNGGILRFTDSCKISYSGLLEGFHCYCFQSGSTITFLGTYSSKFGWKRGQTQNVWIELWVLDNGIVSLKGDLKK